MNYGAVDGGGNEWIFKGTDGLDDTGGDGERLASRADSCYSPGRVALAVEPLSSTIKPMTKSGRTFIVPSGKERPGAGVPRDRVIFR